MDSNQADLYRAILYDHLSSTSLQKHALLISKIRGGGEKTQLLCRNPSEVHFQQLALAVRLSGAICRVIPAQQPQPFPSDTDFLFAYQTPKANNYPDKGGDKPPAYPLSSSYG